MISFCGIHKNNSDRLQKLVNFYSENLMLRTGMPSQMLLSVDTDSLIDPVCISVQHFLLSPNSILPGSNMF